MSSLIKGCSSRVLLADHEGGQQCKQIQQHVDWHHAPPEELRSIHSPWPFHTWGIDILGLFTLAVRQMKYLVVAIEYFTKWIKAEPVAQIISHKVQHFVWKNIVCHFGIPKHLVFDNDTQFASQQLGKLFTKLEHELVPGSLDMKIMHSKEEDFVQLFH